MQNTYILSGSRTPIGSLMGSLSTVAAPKLGAIAIESALSKASIKADQVQAAFMGNVIQAGVGQAPARQAALFAGLSESTPCVTVNKVCGSGLQTIINGHHSIAMGDADILVSGGMENMSLAPHLLPNSRKGYKFGPQEIKDAMQWDGLWDVYSDQAMGACAEQCVKEHNLTREAQDEFAIQSFKRAQQAIEKGIFAREIAPVTISSRKGDTLVEVDEGPGTAKFDKIPQLRPVFDKAGTITAANASSINDGAAAVILASEKYRDQAKFRIVSYGFHAQNPTWFATAPIKATEMALGRAKLSASDIDFYEINEAFAAVTMAMMKEFKLGAEIVNPYGGAVSLGHPIGCSGTRIVVTLMNALESEKKRYGCAAICIGGGEALSLIIERL